MLSSTITQIEVKNKCCCFLSHFLIFDDCHSATPPIKLSWHVIFCHDEYEKNLFLSPQRCHQRLCFKTQSLSRHTFSLGPSPMPHRGLTGLTLLMVCMTLLQDSSVLVGVDS